MAYFFVFPSVLRVGVGVYGVGWAGGGYLLTRGCRCEFGDFVRGRWPYACVLERVNGEEAVAVASGS